MVRTKHLIQVQDKRKIRLRYLRPQETERATMKNNITTMMLATAALCVGLHPASANLLGMPLNLKVALERSDVSALTPACQFYTDDVLSGPLLVTDC
jgi:hypothetical protein